MITMRSAVCTPSSRSGGHRARAPEVEGMVGRQHVDAIPATREQRDPGSLDDLAQLLDRLGEANPFPARITVGWPIESP